MRPVTVIPEFHRLDCVPNTITESINRQRFPSGLQVRFSARFDGYRRAFGFSMVRGGGRCLRTVRLDLSHSATPAGNIRLETASEFRAVRFVLCRIFSMVMRLNVVPYLHGLGKSGPPKQSPLIYPPNWAEYRSENFGNRRLSDIV